MLRVCETSRVTCVKLKILEHIANASNIALNCDMKPSIRTLRDLPLQIFYPDTQCMSIFAYIDKVSPNLDNYTSPTDP